MTTFKKLVKLFLHASSDAARIDNLNTRGVFRPYLLTDDGLLGKIKSLLSKVLSRDYDVDILNYYFDIDVNGKGLFTIGLPFGDYLQKNADGTVTHHKRYYFYDDYDQDYDFSYTVSSYDDLSADLKRLVDDLSSF